MLFCCKRKTANSRFVIPISIHEFSTCSISAGSHQVYSSRCIQFIIWDETPVISKYYSETLDKRMRDILKCDKVFGGKVIVVGAYFLHTKS